MSPQTAGHRSRPAGVSLGDAWTEEARLDEPARLVVPEGAVDLEVVGGCSEVHSELDGVGCDCVGDGAALVLEGEVTDVEVAVACEEAWIQ